MLSFILRGSWIIVKPYQPDGLEAEFVKAACEMPAGVSPFEADVRRVESGDAIAIPSLRKAGQNTAFTPDRVLSVGL